MLTLANAALLAVLIVGIIGPLYTRYILVKSKLTPEQVAISTKLDDANASLIGVQESQIVHLKEQIVSLQGRVDKLESDYRIDIALRDTEIARLKADNATLRADLADARDERTRLYARNAQHEIHIEDLTKGLEALGKRVVRSSDDTLAGAENRTAAADGVYHNGI